MPLSKSEADVSNRLRSRRSHLGIVNVSSATIRVVRILRTRSDCCNMIIDSENQSQMNVSNYRHRRGVSLVRISVSISRFCARVRFRGSSGVSNVALTCESRPTLVGLIP